MVPATDEDMVEYEAKDLRDKSEIEDKSLNNLLSSNTHNLGAIKEDRSESSSSEHEIERSKHSSINHAN